MKKLICLFSTFSFCLMFSHQALAADALDVKMSEELQAKKEALTKQLIPDWAITLAPAILPGTPQLYYEPTTGILMIATSYTTLTTMFGGSRRSALDYRLADFAAYTHIGMMLISYLTSLHHNKMVREQIEALEHPNTTLKQ
jgi:hypothetical protein